eukprot:Transcript_26393.p1 GENE.Transcript_26393~~Transcript_26393.p1  ORF type:complete len:454 (-),score=197.64 Transcript_26393:69-1376(-)
MSDTAKASVDERTTALEAEITALKRELSSLKGEEVAEPPGVSREESVLHPVRGRELNETEKNHDERIRTLCFVIMASAVVYYLVLTLREVLVPFFLALAIKYMLSPLINVLSCDKRAYPQCDKWRWRMHRGLAICIAMVLAAGVLAVLGVLVVRSVGVFASNAGMYNDRLVQIVDNTFALVDALERAMHSTNSSEEDNGARTGMAFLQSQLDTIDLGEYISIFLDHAAVALENMIYILLFLVFMLVGESEMRQRNKASDEAEQQIYVYIRGKLALSCLVAGAHGLTLWCIGCDLWLVFFILTFSLNFVPNIGMFIAVMLPMPLVALDPRYSAVQIMSAFLVPAAVGTVSKDLLEPLLIGNSTSLQPVALMLAIMIWGSVWGLTGMILAVPMTAVMRIHLSYIEHPLMRYFASMLDGTDGKYLHLHQPRRDTPPLL